MINRHKTLTYVPIKEIVTFLLISMITIVLFMQNGFHLAALIVFILLAYLFILGGTNIIRISNGKLSITYFYIIFLTEVVELKDIVKIESQQTFEDESVDLESIFYELRIKYQVEFRDERNILRKLNFKILNNRKEAEIVTELRNLLQKQDGSQ